MALDDIDLEIKGQLLGSFLKFTQVFYKLRTGRDFIISQPVSQESHFITISRAFTQAFFLEIENLLINCPPGFGKSELCKHFIAWAWAHYPDCKFLYITHSYELAEKHTFGVKQIIDLPFYNKIFGVSLSKDSRAKGKFNTNFGGEIYAFGLKSGVTGYDMGMPGLERFSGAGIVDDAHMVSEVHSDTIRDTVIRNYKESISQRIRGKNVPLIFIGQRLHEVDLPGQLRAGLDGRQWHQVVLTSEDEHGNILYPEVHSREFIENEKVNNEYVWASQHMQNPQPAGGGIFKPEGFVLLDFEPKILFTFITADTAETEKTYNDATVFSFWGVYKIMQGEVETDLYGLHWLSCLEIRVEPKDLHNEFMNFYYGCMRHKIKPKFIVIEKKSTGVTLSSVIKELQGIEVVDFPRIKNKTDRFLACQGYVASRQISFTRYAEHAHKCIEHCRKITANQSHAFDDICDTLSDAVHATFIDKIIISRIENTVYDPNIAYLLTQKSSNLNLLKQQRHGNVY